MLWWKGLENIPVGVLETPAQLYLGVQLIDRARRRHMLTNAISPNRLTLMGSEYMPAFPRQARPYYSRRPGLMHGTRKTSEMSKRAAAKPPAL